MKDQLAAFLAFSFFSGALLACSPGLLSRYQSSFLLAGSFAGRPAFCGGRKLSFDPGSQTIFMRASQELEEYAKDSASFWNKGLDRHIIEIKALASDRPEPGNGVSEIYIGSEDRWRALKKPADSLAATVTKIDLVNFKQAKTESDIIFNPHEFQNIAHLLKSLNQGGRRSLSLKNLFREAMGSEGFESYLSARENHIIYTMDHEMGHVFGLDHVEDPKNIMYHNKARFVGKSGISRNQILAIQCFFDSA